ncbi:phosphatidylinositol-4-phosphate 5-kinase (PIP5K)-like protein, partial [Thalassiosira pseudonana CCMP1335]
HKYKFKVYAPLIFARIRSLFGVEKQTFLHSICGKFNFYEFASNARSGQFFFYSHDGRYMIKTLTYTESKFLREILPFYYRHLSAYPHTFLTHFYGMYRVCLPNLNNQRLHFIIMRSVFNTDKKIDRVWDLKGSKKNRKSKEGDSVGKDLDILQEGRKLKFVDPEARGAFLEQLMRDATFLARLGIMDYSLLLGLHNCDETEANESNNDAPLTPKPNGGEEEEPEPSRSNTPFRRNVLSRASTTSNESVNVSPAATVIEAHSSSSPSRAPKANTQQSTPIYFCGVIDILQYYNARKIGETVMRQATGNATQDISCVDPESYGRRFVKFISNLV